MSYIACHLWRSGGFIKIGSFLFNFFSLKRIYVLFYSRIASHLGSTGVIILLCFHKFYNAASVPSYVISHITQLKPLFMEIMSWKNSLFKIH